MKRPFVLLGGSAFGFLMLAACVQTGAVKALVLICAALGLCALFGLAVLWLREKRIYKKLEELSGQKRPRAFSVLRALALILLAGTLSLSLYARAWEKSAAPVEKLDGVEARIRGTVLDYPQEMYHEAYYRVRVEKVSVNGKILEMPEFTARVSTWTPFSCQPYDALECTVKFSLFSDSGGLYSGRNSWLADGVAISAYLSDYETVTVIPDPGGPLGEWAVRWRHTLGRSLEKRLPSEEAGLIRAVLLGEKERVSDQAYENFKMIGASHLLVISGLHMTALAACFSLLAAALRLNRVGRNLLTAGMIVGFLFLIAFPVSAVRSGIMYLIALLAGCLGRQADSLNSLGFAVLAICLANPFSGGDLSFALSVFSTLGILLAASRISQRLLRPFEKRPRLRRLVSPAAKSFGVTFSAQLFTLPLQIMVFGGISLMAPIASLVLVLPCTLLLYVSLGAAFFGVFPVLSPLAEPFSFCAGWLARFSMGAAECLARVPGAYLNLSRPVWILVLVGVLVFLSAMWIFSRSRPAVCAALLGILLLSGCGRVLESGDGTVTLAAVPDSSCVVVMKDRRAAVLSLGGYRTDAAANLLYRNDISRVEVLCLPVRDQDAREAAVDILETFGAEKLAMPTDAYLGRDLLLAGKRSARAYLEDGDEIEVLDGVKIKTSCGMERLEAEIYGVTVMVETGETGAGSCGILFTTQTESRVNSSFTVLQNDDIIDAEGGGRAADQWGSLTALTRDYRGCGIIEGQSESALAALPSGQYIFPDGNGLYLDVCRDGSVSFRGESVCLN